MVDRWRKIWKNVRGERRKTRWNKNAVHGSGACQWLSEADGTAECTWRRGKEPGESVRADAWDGARTCGIWGGVSMK